MKFNLRKVLAVSLLGVLFYVGWSIWQGIGKMEAALASFHWWAFVAACALAFGNYVLRFLKWEFYLARLGIKDIGKVDSFLTFLSGFVLTVSPGKVGEAFKSFILFETHGVPIAKTAPIVVAERVTDVLGIAILIAVASLGFQGGLIWAGIGVGLVSVLIAFMASEKLALFAIGLVEKMPARIAKIAPKLRHSRESLATMLAPRNLVFPTFISTAAWMLECLALYVILRGFGATPSLMFASFVYATSTLAGALAIITPGGMGVTEGALVAQLHEVGKVPMENASATTILVRFATLWFAVLVGFAALTILKRRYPTLLRDKKDA
jgi:uncharacterized protein (TIRG00374 family)